MLTLPIYIWFYVRDAWLYVRIYGLRVKDKMAEKNAVKNCLAWIADEQTVHETADYGSNMSGVQAALREQQRRVKIVQDFKPEADKVARSTESREDGAAIKAAYEGLVEIANKRLACLEDMAKIAGLEGLFGMLSSSFAERATSLVTGEACGDVILSERGNEGMAKAAQNCILAVRTNWSWMSKLIKCADLHLQHVSEYHQFFHEIKEYQHWMPVELTRAQNLAQCAPSGSADKDDACRIHVELKEALAVFMHWQAKVEGLIERSKNVVPVHLRTAKLDHCRPVSSLCDYQTKQINIREQEELQLIDNSNPQTWTVRNMHSTKSDVPSTICVIPGPDPAAVQAAMTLRLQLLGMWTITIKRVGQSIFYTLLQIFRDWNAQERRQLAALSDSDKTQILKVVDAIESSLRTHWSEYAGFKKLKVRFDLLRKILAERGDPTYADSAYGRHFVSSVGRLGDVSNSYQEFWSYWDTYRLVCETSRQPEFLLLLERWQQLKLVEILPLLKKWNIDLHFDESECLAFDSVDSQVQEEVVEQSTEAVQEAVVTKTSESVTMAVETTEEKSSSEQVTTMEQEEKKTFVITGVLDPRSNEEVSMQQAVMLGIIDSQKGLYVNPITGDKIPIPVAMNAGKIKVEFTSTKKTKEKRRDIGLITIKMLRESRPYTVKAVIDTQTNTEVTVDEAIERGILDQKNGLYRNEQTGSEMSIGDALEQGLLIVEFDKSAPVTDPKSEIVTYAIHHVVDVKMMTKVTFTEAVRLGLLDTHTGAFYNTKTDENMYVGDAIKRGFIKATFVKDPSSLDIDAENKVFIDKVQTIRQKLVKPMAALSALRKAAEASGKKSGGN